MDHPNAQPSVAQVAQHQTRVAAARQPRPYPTAWESIPSFVRFAAWIASLLVILSAAAAVASVFLGLIIAIGAMGAVGAA